jgi:hypothetical protein
MTTPAKIPENKVTVLEPMNLLQIAVQRGASIDELDKLLQLERQYKADCAREAYVNAMTAFRSEAISVIKAKHVSFGQTNYKYATLAKILEIVVPALAKHGLSHNWETKQDGPAITVSCIITHAQGHSERTSLSAAPDQSGGKNAIQAVGSAVSYLERYTFMALTGLAASDQDDDGQRAEVEYITDKQAADLDVLIAEVGADKAAFLKWARVEALSEIAAKDYSNAVRMLERKRKQ